MRLFKFVVALAMLLAHDCPYAALQDHFKKAEGKSNDHTMRNIDFIYMINLDSRPQKYALAMKFLDTYGIKPYRFSAVNGWELSLEEILDVGVKFKPGMTPLLGTTFLVDHGKLITSHEFMQEYGKTYFVHCMAPGAIGCALSHLSVLQDAYDSGYETIWVMEDDVETLQDPHLLSDLIEELDSLVGHNRWDVLFTDQDYRTGVNQYLPAYGAAKRPDMDNRPEERYSDKYTKTVTLNQNFHTVAARFGTASMIIRRSGIIKLLQFAKERNIYLPYDLENYLVPGIKRYGLNYDVVTNMLNSLSDIGQKGS
jgi:GR25 family glycosyltransferase involved in LPS biosynthesis